MTALKNEKTKKVINRKILLGIGSLVVCVVLIAVCSFIPFIVDPTRWQTSEFLTDELVICAIVIVSMISAMFIGQASNAQNEQSSIAKSRAKFFETIELVTDFGAFGQWVKKVLQPKDIKALKERKMRAVGIEDFSVLDLEFEEIKSLLETPRKINDRYYKGLSKAQIKELIKIKRGKYKVELVDPEYYLSVKNLIDPRTITERSSKEGTKKSLYLAKSIISKLALSVVSAMIFASLMKDLSESADTASAIWKFVSRIWAMASSSFMGYLVGNQMNDIDAEYIEMRVMVQNMFIQDKTFVPLSQQELAKEEFMANKVKQKGTKNG